MRTIVVTAAVVLTIVVGGCVRCPVGTMRCRNNTAEACLSNGFWHSFEDCAQVSAPSGGERVCCEPSPDAGAACLPSKECANVTQ